VVMFASDSARAEQPAHTANLQNGNGPAQQTDHRLAQITKTVVTSPPKDPSTSASAPDTSPACGEQTNYIYAVNTGVPMLRGDTRLPGSVCDDCVIPFQLPFPVTLYGESFSSLLVGSNGVLTFGDSDTYNPYSSACLQYLYYPSWRSAVFPLWNDWDMREEAQSGQGIFTKVVGTAPARILVVEWRACLWDNGACNERVNFEIRFYENSPYHPFDFVYGQPLQAAYRSSAGIVSGLNWPNNLSTQYGVCGQYNFAPGIQVEWFQPDCNPLNTPTPTATPQPPRCPGERFTDVCPGDYFFEPVLTLNDAGIVSGYNSAPPCATYLHIPCFKPYNNSTRAQMSKIVSLAAGFQEPVSGQTFQDILPGNTFYEYIERLAGRNIISGYACGGPGEPCVPPANRPYFRPGSLVTRAQLTKMICIAFGFAGPPGAQMFEDVLPGSTFFDYIQRLATMGIINGYVCGGPNEPCVPPYNRAYFRQTRTATRGQAAKIVSLAINPPTPTPTVGPPTLTPTVTGTATRAPTPTFCLTNYTVYVDSNATVEPATSFVPESNCDDCVSVVSLPFPFRFYDLTFTLAYLSSNGSMQFVSKDSAPDNACLPTTNFNYAIIPHWDDQLLTGPGQGIYTTVAGSAPYRVFIVEWKGTYADGGGYLDYEVRLYENSPSGLIHVIYGSLPEGGSGATVGLQRDSGSLYTQYECNSAVIAPGQRLTFIVSSSNCNTPTRTPSPTNTGTPTENVSPSATYTYTPTEAPTETGTPTSFPLK